MNKNFFRSQLKETNGDFPGGSVVKNLPANEDTGLIPDRGRSHMPQSS